VKLRGITFPIPVPGLDAALDIRLLFDDVGRVIASVREAAELGTMLMVFDEPHPSRPLSLQSVTTHLLDGDAVVLVSRTIFEDVRFDEPLDERLLDLDAGGRSGRSSETAAPNLLSMASPASTRQASPTPRRDAARTAVRRAAPPLACSPLGCCPSHDDDGALRPVYVASRSHAWPVSRSAPRAR
jgi:hypothetical protein